MAFVVLLSMSGCASSQLEEVPPMADEALHSDSVNSPLVVDVNGEDHSGIVEIIKTHKKKI